jgi:pectate lyase
LLLRRCFLEEEKLKRSADISDSRTKVTTVFPSATGETQLPSATVISGVFDGKMARWHRNCTGQSPNSEILTNKLPAASVCQGQTETGEADTIFILEDGATIANVIIGKNQAEGIHCRGTCTIINVWHEEVCEGTSSYPLLKLLKSQKESTLMKVQTQ